MLGGLCSLHAQNPVANFSANVTSGCAPLTVTFTDQSSGNPTSWNWEFSNGTLSSAQNPVITFSTPGTYSVRLVVQNATGIGQTERIDYITVNPAPVANFAANLTLACLPANIQFTDASTTAAGSIVSWNWDFGDGNTSTQQNPSHSYTNTGFYTVTLRVVSSTGCAATRTRTNYVRVVGNIAAEFGSTPPLTCRAPFLVSFQNQSNGPGNISYNWNFGNGTSSTSANPTASFAAPGTYNVTLNAVSDLGCTGSIQKTINISGATTDFTTPTDICLRTPVTFQNNSSPAPLSSSWTFGDGTSSGQINPSKIYLTPGTYTVRVINQYASCTDSATRTVTVSDSPGVDFAANDSTYCQAPATVQFTDLTPAAVSWIWDFGDGGSSTLQNPSHTYAAEGNFDVTLIAVTASGCRDTIRKPAFIRVQRPLITLNLPSGGCIPFTYRPVATINTLDSVATYSWDLGAPGGNFNVRNPPPFTYTNAGNYNVSLTITTVSGCTQTVTVPNGILTGVRPTAAFTVTPSSSCASDTFRFTNNSVTTPGAAVEWIWDFGDGTGSEEFSPNHVYQDTGYLMTVLAVSNNRCISRDTQYVTISPPVARFWYSVDCISNAVTFTDESIVDPSLSPLSWTWNFGHPSIPNSTLQNPPAVNYPGPGAYTVTLTVNNGACSYVRTGIVRIANEAAAFTSSATGVCPGENITLTATGSNAANIRRYIWTVGSTVLSDTTRTATFTSSAMGSFDVTLSVVDINGCVNTLTQPNFLTVSGPAAQFTVAQNGDCASQSFNFTDQSTSAAPIRSWTFDYGDGTTQNYTAPPFTHTYSSIGSYVVSMTVVDQNGCRGSYQLPLPLLVSNPKAGFRADTFYCPQAPLSFIDTSAGAGLTYFWDFGDGGTSTDANPQHSYPAGDQDYTIKLVVTDINGCIDSVIRPNYIRIRSPKAAFSIRDSTSICPPLRTTFQFEGSDYQSFYWAFGDGGSTTLQNPSHFYGAPGVYTPTLYLQGPGGCVDSAQSNVTVHNTANVRLNYGPITQACNSLNVDFDLQLPPGFKFILYFGDGTADSTRRTTLSHFYSKPSFSRPYVIIFDSISGCQSTVFGPTRIDVLGAIPLFGVDRTQFCDTGTVRFTDFTTRNEPIINTRWTFGDGNTSSLQSPTHLFTQPGTYIVRLDVTTQSNCSSFYQDTILVYRTPSPLITARDTICIGQQEPFGGSIALPDSVTTWLWNFGNGQTSTDQNSQATYTTAGNFTISLIATNAIGCSDTIIHPVYVSPLPTATPVQDPITIISGASAPLQMTYTGPINQYNWTPQYRLDCFDCPEPVANPASTTTYRVDLESRYGCRNRSSVTVNVVCNNLNYFVPNTFSPNGDGRNEQFFPRGTGLFRVKSLLVFNRWGQVVFEARDFLPNDPSRGWDGRFKGQPASPDVYIYMMEIECENKVVIPIKGNITLLR